MAKKDIVQVKNPKTDRREEIYPPGPVDPVRLVEEALEQLHSRLTAAVQDYPIANPRAEGG